MIKFFVEDIGIDNEAKDSSGYTTLNIASVTDQQGIVEYLVERGADIETYNNYRNTPLINASRYVDDTNIIKFLFDQGANTFHRNNKGEIFYSYLTIEQKVEIQDYVRDIQHHKVMIKPHLR